MAKGGVSVDVTAEQLADGFGLIWYRVDAARVLWVAGLVPVPFRAFPARPTTEGGATQVTALVGSFR